jgi:hypothetical protein
MAKKEETKSDFMTNRWRPMMAIVYMAINICDFILFPVLWAVVQFWETSAANDAFRQWAPLTLQGGGFIHMAFGAILGISAWTRGKEKIAAVENGSAEPAAESDAEPAKGKYAVDE